MTITKYTLDFKFAQDTSQSHPHVWTKGVYIAGLILGSCPANERRRYKVTPSLIGWAQT